MTTKKTLRTLPYTLLFASGVVMFILIANVLSTGKFTIGPAAIVLFVLTFFVVKNAFFKKPDDTMKP